jgi:hypothetical protein
VHLHLFAADPPRTAPTGPVSPSRHPLRSIAKHPVTIHLTVFLSFIGAGIGLNWPHVTWLSGKLPYTRDGGSYVWGFWWMAHSVLHLSDPWLTNSIAAPANVPLGLHALMPLAGVVMLPVTLVFGPSASYTLLSVLLPGLMAYAMYRVGRLWVPSQVGAIATGAFFGFAGMLDYQAWLHLNLAAGALFLPITLEAAIRLRRKASPGSAVVFGLVLGAALLVDQESAVLALILALVAVIPWLLPYRKPAAAESQPAAASKDDDDTQPSPSPSPSLRTKAVQLLSKAARGGVRSTLRLRVRWRRVLLLGLAAAVALIAAAPQLIAIAHAKAAGSPPAYLSAPSYLLGIRLPDMFLPSPRVTSFGLNITHARNPSTYGALPSLLALIGLALAWRRRSAWGLALLWLAAAALAIGSDISLKSASYTPLPVLLHGVKVSSVLPFTWFAQIPGLSGFREPSRVAWLGLVPVALLAGYTVNWLRYHARVLLVAVFALGLLEAGLATPPGTITMATNYPALDQPIAADHSGSIVLDLPFGLRGGTGFTGLPFAPQAQVLATADGHPIADAFVSRVPTSTINAIEAEPFYRDLLAVQKGDDQLTYADLQQAAENAAHMHIGWVLLWTRNKLVREFMTSTGFSYSYWADGVSVWRPDGYANGVTTSP